MPTPMPLPVPRSGAATPNYPQSPLRITHDGEFYARLLTKESSLANPSFRYYGAGPGAVPFGWESQPGTPKDCASCSITLSSSADVPAITPPPSYHLRAAAAPHGHGRKGRRGPAGDKSCAVPGGRSKYCCGYRKLRWIKIGFLAALFRRIALGRSRVSSAAETSSAASVQSSSTRWLFSGGSSSSCLEETGAQHYYHYYDPALATKGMLDVGLGGVRPSPWTVQFCGGGARREAAGWQ
ncbi:uncharacterized protein LOC124656938 [Lolium rigidum]|uniref:uncharacterized protein LOC124656938 n=1 Tax=Lolium rigidum TaxID=89674 RepID=UPI001F5D148D|nr:uncharacterized protein LOC124656938 [Lolium rigidum]